MVNYSMAGRTYRYFHGNPLYPFGYGLSYSMFNFTNAWLSPIIEAGQNLTVRVEVCNEGPVDGEEVDHLCLNFIEIHLGFMSIPANNHITYRNNSVAELYQVNYMYS